MTKIHDPLLNCLAFIAKSHGKPISQEGIRAYIPMTQNLITPKLFVYAAEKIGFSVRLRESTIEDISPLTLPVVLLLANNKACVITKIDKEAGKAEIVLPESGDGTETVAIKDLENEFIGQAIFLKPKYEFDARTDEAVHFDGKETWFWDTFWKFRTLYKRVIVSSIFINLFVLAIPLFIMNVYDRVVPNKAIETLWVLAIGVMIVLAFDFILKMLRGYFVDAAGKKADVVISTKLLEHSLNSVMESQPASVGIRANHLKEFEYVREFFSSATVATLVDLPFILLFILVIQFIGGPLFVVPLTSAILLITITIFISIPLNKAIKESYAGGAQKNAIIVESLSGIEELKTSYAQSTFLGKWLRSSALTANSLLKARFFSNLTTTLAIYSVMLAMVCVVIWGVYLIGRGDLTVGGLIACTILTNRAMAPMTQIVGLLSRYQQARCSYKALNTLMETPIEREEGKHYMHRQSLSGNIKFHRVAFHYESQKGEFFKEINLSIREGEHVAILGSLGSGKSTLLKLVEGLYRPTEGRISIDGIDLNQIDPVDLRKNIGYLSQDPKLFFGTVRSNISLKAPWADDQSILKAAELSGAINFINQNPNGFEMIVGEMGKGLSGGQIQTIALARALLFDPPIFLFDEPTTSMDSATENRFIENMSSYLKGKTTLIVTHKHSLLPLIDRIIILQDGAIIMDGPRDQVMQEISSKQKGGAK